MRSYGEKEQGIDKGLKEESVGKRGVGRRGEGGRRELAIW